CGWWWDFFGEGRLKRPSSLGVVLASEVNLFVASKRAENSELVRKGKYLRKQPSGEVQVVSQFDNIEVLWVSFVLFEIETIGVAHRAAKFHEDHVPGAALRRLLARRLDVQWP